MSLALLGANLWFCFFSVCSFVPVKVQLVVCLGAYACMCAATVRIMIASVQRF